MKLLIWSYILILGQILAVVAARSEGDIYGADENIYELTPSNFDKVIKTTNYTSIVKFYAPWCGYCQQLKPAYHKLAKLIHKDGQYAVNVASVNCDKDSNKELCARYQVSGFPTILVFRPPKYDSTKKSKVYNHAVEPYNGERTLKSMHSFVTSRIKNYVKRFPNFQSDGLQEWMAENTETNKVLLISESQKSSSLYKSLAIDFINTLKFGMVSTKTLKNVNKPKIQLNDIEIELPITETDKLPILFSFDQKTKEFTKYDVPEKLNDKVKMSKWLININNVKPLEGPLSKKDIKYYANYRNGQKVKKSKIHDEL